MLLGMSDCLVHILTLFRICFVFFSLQLVRKLQGENALIVKKELLYVSQLTLNRDYGGLQSIFKKMHGQQLEKSRKEIISVVVK